MPLLMILELECCEKERERISAFLDFLKDKKQAVLKSFVLYCPIPLKSKPPDLMYRTMMVVLLPLSHGQ